MKLLPDDPKLTAYALGELDAAERAEVEAALKDSPECRQAVEEIKQLAGTLTRELSAEPCPTLNAARREAVMSGATIGAPAPSTASLSPDNDKIVPFPRRRAVMAAVAALAACVVAVAIIAPSTKNGTPTRVAKNDDAVRFHETNYTGTENGGTTSTVTVVRRGGLAAPLSVEYKDGSSLAGKDSGTLTWGDGEQNKKTFTVPFVDQDGRQLTPASDFRVITDVPVGLSPQSNGRRTVVVTDEQTSESIKDVIVNQDKPDRGGLLVTAAGNSGFKTSDGLMDKQYPLPSVLDAKGTSSYRAYDGFNLDVVDLAFAKDLSGKDWNFKEGDKLSRQPSVDVVSPGTFVAGTSRTELGRVEQERLAAAKADVAKAQMAKEKLDAEAKAKAANSYDKKLAQVEAKWNERKPTAAPLLGDGSVTPAQAEILAKQMKLATDAYGATAHTFDLSNPNTDTAKAQREQKKLADLIQQQQRLAEAERLSTAAYPRYEENAYQPVMQQPLSTFSIDVDTASYANVRRFLNAGQLPPPEAVRIEELVNYFSYKYPPPQNDAPFSVNIESASCPWNGEHRLLRVALKGREIANDKRPPSNFVFLIDVSGSMEPAERLPLIKQGLRMLVKKMNASDHVAIVVYAGTSGLVLASTSCEQKEKILEAIDRLGAGGSTNGGEGIQRAYDVASESFIKGGINRVILCTDGDFNVGITDQNQLLKLIQEKAKSGVFLTTLGVGTDNYKDALMQKLADKGNGNYHYLDSVEEAHKVLVEQMNGTLVTIAKDVKIQIEFNPTQVSAYRLIGYEKRILRKQDFNDDTKDAGEIGAGHTVTAFYEIVPAGTEIRPVVNDLKYQPVAKAERYVNSGSREMLTLKLRYKQPEGSVSKLLEFPFTDGGLTYARASSDFKFASAVASFGMILRNSEYKAGANLDAVLELAEEAKGADEQGYRAEFINLVKKAKALR